MRRMRPAVSWPGPPPSMLCCARRPAGEGACAYADTARDYFAAVSVVLTILGGRDPRLSLNTCRLVGQCLVHSAEHMVRLRRGHAISTQSGREFIREA